MAHRGTVQAAPDFTHLFLQQNTAVDGGGLLNPDFETGAVSPDYWFHSGTSTNWNTTDAHTGSKCVEISVSAADADWRSQAMAVVPSQTYQYGGWVKGTVTADEFFLTVRWWVDANAAVFISEQNIPIPVGSYSTWTELLDTAIAPPNALTADFLFRSVNGSGDVLFDTAVLVSGVAAPNPLAWHVQDATGKDPIFLGANAYLDDVFTSRLWGDTE